MTRKKPDALTPSEVAARRARCTCGQFLHPGKPCGKPGVKPRPIIDRAWEKIDRRGPDECWPWTGGQTGRPALDHQHVARILLGLVPGDPRVARHTCDNPLCCNPAHLVVGTQSDNLGDMVDRGRSSRGDRHWNWKGGHSKNYRTGRNRRTR